MDQSCDLHLSRCPQHRAHWAALNWSIIGPKPTTTLCGGGVVFGSATGERWLCTGPGSTT